MRVLFQPFVAVAEWVVGLLVLAYVAWGLYVDRARAPASGHPLTPRARAPEAARHSSGMER